MSFKSKLNAIVNNPKGVYKKYIVDGKYDHFFDFSKVDKGIRHKESEADKPVNNKQELAQFSFDNPVSIQGEIKNGSYVYIPWIKTHGDKLIDVIKDSTDIEFSPLWLNENIHDVNVRRSVNRISRDNPEVFRRYLISFLAPNKDKIKAVVLTMDWSTPMRLIALVCKELEIKTILIPHEGVFAKESEYYKDVSTGVNTPICDFILCWGEQQKRIFVSRGYPEERIFISGSIKLDTYSTYKPKISKKIFNKLYGFNEEKKTILFACQPLDSQYDVHVARKAQRQIINDLIEFTSENDVQLIIRKPPSGDRILNSDLDKAVYSSPLVFLDYSSPYMSSPEESIANCDVVLSINSTMLFEALLFGKPSISTKYVEFEQIWKNVNIPDPKDKENLFKVLREALNNPTDFLRKIDFSWANKNLSYGDFKGLAIDNIHGFLSSDLSQVSIFKHSDLILDYNKNDINSINVSLNNKVVESNKYLRSILGVNSVYSSQSNLEDIKTDLFLNWGISPTDSKLKQINKSNIYGKDLLIVEDGFLRSCDIGLSNEPGLSVIIDSLTAYYDARKPSKLETTINSSFSLSQNEIERSKTAMNLIRENRLSKYNHAAYVKLNIGNNKNKILLIDQRFGDMSVEAGLANEKTFKNMLLDAIEKYPDYDILIKRHPDATIGGKGSYFSDQSIGFTKDINNVYLIDYDVNPYSLFDIVDKVFCVTSGMGFEALIAGKEVHVYGMPFYANWGLTKDHMLLERRQNTRSLEEVFFFSYIMFSRYVNPEIMAPGQIEDVIKYLIENR